ncbi:MAG: 2Fe-2S ferredoxin-like protein [Idiomarina sp.]|nr:2Fe-2S ferredoxin-like protein [Idiomarina sp.]
MTNTFKVKVNGGPELAVDATEGTLLEALEKHQLEMNYHCRSGFCGACRSTLKSGQVRYTTEPLAYVRKGDILPCCCVPESDLDIEH